MDEEQNIKMKSNDGKDVEISKKAASRSGVLKGIIEDYPDNAEFPINNVNGVILEKVKEYLEHYKDEEPEKIQIPLKDIEFKNCVNEWDYNFLGEDIDFIFNILSAANYMDIKPLLELSSAKLGSKIKGMKSDSVKKDFEIGELTDEEKQQIYEDKKYLEEQNNKKNPILITSSLIREKIHQFFDELKDQIQLYQKNNIDKNEIKIGIIGAPNVGKNSLIQSLELIVNSNCEEKYIFYDDEKTFCFNSVPGITFDEDEKNNFLISKKFKEVKDIPDPIKLINNLMDVIDKNKLKDIYDLNKEPENLDDFINLIKEKYEFENNDITICKILRDIINGRISYEVKY